jgi:hypothetical protein
MADSDEAADLTRLAGDDARREPSRVEKSQKFTGRSAVCQHDDSCILVDTNL